VERHNQLWRNHGLIHPLYSNINPVSVLIRHQISEIYFISTHMMFDFVVVLDVISLLKKSQRKDKTDRDIDRKIERQKE